MNENEIKEFFSKGFIQFSNLIPNKLINNALRSINKNILHGFTIEDAEKANKGSFLYLI